MHCQPLVVLARNDNVRVPLERQCVAAEWSSTAVYRLESTSSTAAAHAAPW